MSKKAIIYVNQFFGQLGGEDTAGVGPSIHEGLIGPAMAYNAQLKDCDVTHTIICGDNYMGSNTEDAVAQILGFLENLEFDIFIAGPAFNAGRYGVACGTICKAVKDRFGVPVITSMNQENPGMEMFRKDIIIMKGGNIASKMRKDLAAVVKVANKMLAGEQVGPAAEEGYFPTGRRHQVFIEEDATTRFMRMLHARIAGEEFVSELIVPKLDRVPIAAPVKDLKQAKVALLTTGGIVPVDNPDRIQSASATRWGKYDITGMERLESGVFKTIHAGFDPAAANADPNVIMPIDVLRAMEKEGVFGSLHQYFYATVGTGTTEKEASRMAKEILPLLQADNVDACIMVST